MELLLVPECSFAIISLRKRELFALLELYSCCHVTVSCTRCLGVGLWSAIVAFTSHTHLPYGYVFRISHKHTSRLTSMKRAAISLIYAD